tara:strand:- start:181 stop:630 length:450 start_codon:yes stop_codon:yes gene_type:complete
VVDFKNKMDKLSLNKILKKFDFKKDKISKEPISIFIVNITGKYISSKNLQIEEVKLIISSLGIKKIFFQISGYELNKSVKSNFNDFEIFLGDIYFKYKGKDFFLDFKNKKFPQVLEDTFFICENNIIAVWDHHGRLIIYKYKRVRATKL